LADLIKYQTLPYMIVDCRFDYEYEGGHIDGAINLTSPLKVEEYFFKNKETIERLMNEQTAIIFHCEFS